MAISLNMSDLVPKGQCLCDCAPFEMRKPVVMMLLEITWHIVIENHWKRASLAALGFYSCLGIQ